MEYVEGLLGDSVDKHAKWETAHAKLTTFQRGMRLRMCNDAALVDRMSRLLGESAVKHAKWEAAHAY